MQTQIDETNQRVYLVKVACIFFIQNKHHVYICLIKVAIHGSEGDSREIGCTKGEQPSKIGNGQI